MSHFGTKFKELRLEKNMTQKEVAFLLNTRQNVISAWESGQSRPILKMALKVANFFNVSYDEIIIPLIKDTEETI